MYTYFNMFEALNLILLYSYWKWHLLYSLCCDIQSITAGLHQALIFLIRRLARCRITGSNACDGWKRIPTFLLIAGHSLPNVSSDSSLKPSFFFISNNNVRIEEVFMFLEVVVEFELRWNLGGDVVLLWHSVLEGMLNANSTPRYEKRSWSQIAGRKSRQYGVPHRCKFREKYDSRV